MNSGSNGTARLCPGATAAAASMLWKYSILFLPRLRCEQLGTMDLVRAMVLGAVQRDQQMAVEAAHGTEPAGLAELGHDIGEHRMEMRRIDRIERGATWLSPGILPMPNRVWQVRPALAVFQVALMRQERGALQEERGFAGRRERRRPTRNRPWHRLRFCYAGCPARSHRSGARRRRRSRICTRTLNLISSPAQSKNRAGRRSARQYDVLDSLSADGAAGGRGGPDYPDESYGGIMWAPSKK